MKRLLEKSRTERLGAGGWKTLFDHPWLKDVDIGTLDDKASVPFTPPANGQHVPDPLDIGDFKNVGKQVKIEPGDFDEAAWTFASSPAPSFPPRRVTRARP